MGLWPYRLLKRDDEDIKADLQTIMRHFADRGQTFDVIVFVPNAGKYLCEQFVKVCEGPWEIRFVTVRRASTVSKEGRLKKMIFRNKWLANLMRHVDVLWRLIEHKLKRDQKMVAETVIDFDIEGQKILLIDDDVATGTTVRLVKSKLLERGASSVVTAAISNHFLPDEIQVDYCVYRYKLLRTKNSRDYDAR